MANKTICVIEDNLPIRRLFTTVVQKSGYSGVDFSDGASAMEWLSKGEPLYAIVMDILLPDINGTDLIKQVRALDSYKSTAIIAVTGFAQSNDREKFLAAGFDGYIPKPINANDFISEIEQIVNSK